MSEIITDKLTGKTSAGDVTITSEGGSATMQLQQGVAKCWVKYDQKTDNQIDDSFATSSVSDLGTGDAHWNLSNAFANTDAVMSGATSRTGTPAISGNSGFTLNTSSQYQINTLDAGSSTKEDTEWGAIGHGDLA